MDISEIRLDIEAIEQNAALSEETNFNSRADAIDNLEFNVIDRIEGLLHTINRPDELIALKQYADRVKRRLEDINNNLFRRLRADIRAGVCRGAVFKSLIDQYVGRVSSGGSQPPDEIGYDSLDLFINGLLLSQAAPTETKDREPEMVYYQQTPARIILELVEKAHLTEKDIFYDVGSGLGQVPILVHLLTGATAKGVEFEPAYSDYARESAVDLNLSGVEFINTDARIADFSDGTVFFMYTPFAGRLLQAVLDKLLAESQQRVIKLFSYGPCTLQLARQSWLKSIDQNEAYLYKLGVFTTLL